MADPLSLIGGVTVIVQLSNQVASFIKTAKDATSDRKKLLCEINATSSLCQTLADYAELDELDSNERWKATFGALCVPDGPVEQFRTTLIRIEQKLVISKVRPRLMHALEWPFSKNDVMEIVADIERQKSLFTLALSNDSLRLSLAMREDVRSIARGLTSVQLQQEMQNQQVQEIAGDLAADNRRALLSDLSPIDFQSTHSDIFSRRAAETGNWLLQTCEFRDWVGSSRGILWCRGIPGSGKTILASLVIDTFRAVRWAGLSALTTDSSPLLRQEHEPIVVPVGLAGIYCSYRSADTTAAMLGSIIRQLSEPLADLPESVAVASAMPSVIRHAAAFADIVPFYEDIVIVVDALDECTTRDELLKELRKFCNFDTNCHVRILVTSRSGIADIERELGTDSMKIEIRSSKDDVRKFLRQSLSAQTQLSQWIDESPDFEKTIVETILDRITGMFLLARLYMDILAQIPSKRGIRKALNSLPVGIEETYAEAWNRICAQRPHQAAIGRKVLAWITHSARPIRVREITYALAVEEGDEELDEEGILDATTLTSFCAGLVIIDEESKLLSLVHPTTQEYFNARRARLLPNGHEDIAMACITYLRMRPFSNEGATTDPQAFNRRVSESCLLGYAAVFWGQHAREANSERVCTASLALLRNEKTRSAASQALLLNIAGAQDWGTEWPEYSESESGRNELWDFEASTLQVPAIHLSSFFGLERAARMLLKSGSKINELDGMGGTAIHWALLGEQNIMLGFVLEEGADPNINRKEVQLRRWHMTGLFTLPLTIAAWTDNVTAIKLLLQHGAEIDKSQQEDGVMDDQGTALSTALYARKDAATYFLLESGADPNLDASGIYWTSTHGNLDIMKKLIDTGLTQDNLYEALAASASAGQATKVHLLLQAGANPGPTSIYEESTKHGDKEKLPKEADWPPQTALVSSIKGIWTTEESNPFKCFCLLIEAGASVNHICCRSYFYADDIITSGIDNNIWSCPPDRATTPMLTAAYFGHLDMIRILAEKNADLNFVSTVPPLPHPLKAALDSESYLHRLAEEDSDSTEKTSSLRVRDTLKLMTELGADPKLCSQEDQERIQQLLAMSEVDCEILAAFQRILAQPQYGQDDHDRPYRERKEQLLELMGGGADPKLCCKRDRDRMDSFLTWTEEKLDALDAERLSRKAELDRIMRGPLMA